MRAASTNMICWQPVILDCNGGLEPAAVTYVHEVALVPPQGFIPCDIDGVAAVCPLPRPDPQFTIGPHVASECAPTPEPAVGEVVMLRTTVFDAAGNEDCGT